jgi:hypothetical protein
MAGIEVLSEGYDEKSVSYVIMARPTTSEALYPQSRWPAGSSAAWAS